MGHLAQIDGVGPEERLHLPFEVSALPRFAHLGRQQHPETGGAGDVDGPVRSFVGRHAAQEDDILAVGVAPAVTEGEGRRVETVMDDPGNRDVRRGTVLGVGDGDDGDAGAEGRVEVGELVVERSMDGGDHREVGEAFGVEGTHHGVVVDHVMVGHGAIGMDHVAQLGHGHADAHPLGVLEGPFLRYRAGGVARGEQGDVVARGHEAPRHLVDHQLDPPVERRWDRCPRWGDEGDPHGLIQPPAGPRFVPRGAAAPTGRPSDSDPPPRSTKRRSRPLQEGGSDSIGSLPCGGVAEWFRQGPAKPRTAVRFRPPPLRI